MRLQVGAEPGILEPDEATVEQAVRSLLSFGQDAFAVLENSEDDYLQAMRGDAYTGKSRLRSRLIVEYRDGSVQRHYRMNNVPIDTAVRLFQLYRSGEPSWKDHMWKDVSTEFKWPAPEHDCANAATSVPNGALEADLPPFTIFAPNTPQQYVVVCVACNAPCELQRPSLANAAVRIILTGGIGFFASALDSWWRCHSCRRNYRQSDFRKGRIQQQKYTGTAMPTYQPALKADTKR